MRLLLVNEYIVLENDKNKSSNKVYYHITAMDFSQIDLEGLYHLIENDGIPSEFVNDAIDCLMNLTRLPEVCFYFIQIKTKQNYNIEHF